MNNKVDVQINGGGGIVPCTYKTVVLKPNFVGQKNLLTQTMMNEQDTKYVIKHDYTIGGGITGTADVHYVSFFENEGWDAAHEAWIAADNAYTNGPNETTLATKNAAYAALQNTPRYYYYDRKQVVVRARQYISVPNGCILFSAAGAQVEFPNGVAEADTVVYICSLTQGDYEYSLTNAILMPEGCLIEFDGGSISDGVIVCNNTIFVYNQPEETVLKNVELLGDYEMNAGGGNADKKDNTNGMGKITLKANKGFAEQLTQDNTIYVIRYDFDLDDEEVTIPENCVLEFDGGSLRNGTVIFNETIILGDVDFRDCSFQGSLYKNQKLFISNFGVKANGDSDDSFIINSILKCIEGKGCEVVFDCNEDYGIGSDTNHTTIKVFSNTALTFTGTGFLKLLSYSSGGQVVLIEGNDITINNILIDGGGNNSIAGGSGQNGIGVISSEKIVINGGVIRNCYKGEDLDSNEGLALGAGGKGIQVEPSNVHNMYVKGVLIENCFRAISVRRDFNYEGPIICHFDNIHAKGCDQFMSIHQVNGQDITGKECKVSVTNFIIEDCGTYDGVFIFSRARNIDLVNGIITGTVTGNNIEDEGYIGAIFIGRFAYSNIININVSQKCQNVFDFTPLAYAEDTNKVQYINVDINVFEHYNYFGRSEGDYSNKGAGESIIKLCSQYKPTSFSLGSPFSGGKLFLDLNFIEDSTHFVGDITQFYCYSNNINNIDGTVFGGFNTTFVNRTSERSKALYKVGATCYDTNLRKLVVKYGSADSSLADVMGFPADAKRYGTFDEKPTTSTPITSASLRNFDVGFQYFNTDNNNTIIWNGTKWYEYDGVTAGVSRTGTFSNKPSANNIYIGFRYFCTDRQTIEGATDGIEIIHKGNDVWVDALGRVVS